MPSSFLVSPAEPAIIKAMGRVSSVPEMYGSDILWAEAVIGGTVGVQRKEYKDLVASVHDDRLAREVKQMRGLSLAFLVVEGNPRWGEDGKLIHKYITWTRENHRSLLRSVQSKGIYVEFSDDEADTVVLVESIARYLNKENHEALERRPKPVASGWGMNLKEEDFACHVLQSFKGIGSIQARAIYSKFGRVPFKLDCTPDELLTVPGLGAKKVADFVRVFGVSMPEKKSRGRKSPEKSTNT